jgi:hypothetical protein
MVERYFYKATEELRVRDGSLKVIKSEMRRVLRVVLGRVKEKLLTNKKASHKSSSSDNYSSEFAEDANNESLMQLVSNKEFIEKLAKERSERERKKLEREEKTRRKMMLELEAEENRRSLEMQLKEEEKRKRVEELLKKKEERRKKLDEFKDLGDRELREVAGSKPLFMRIEENYEENVLMPELEKKKAELAKKRELFQPIRRGEIVDHMRKYHESALESQARRELNFKSKQLEFKYNSTAFMLKSHFTERILEDQHRKKEESEKLETEKKFLVEKKKKYASMVKDMFIPSVDEFKRQEMLLIKEKLKHPVRIRLNSEGQSGSEEEMKVKHNWKKNPLLPEPVKRKEPKVVDYLAEQRQKRGNSVGAVNLSGDWESVMYDDQIGNDEKVKILRKKAAQLERKAHLFEGNMKSPDSVDNHTLNVADTSNSLLLDAIKAKLAILSQKL